MDLEWPAASVVTARFGSWRTARLEALPRVGENVDATQSEVHRIL